MAKLEHYYTQFAEGRFYHIYNRAIDKQPLFKNDGNCEFFLRKYNDYLSPVVDTYAYCLLGNHFHLLLKVQDEHSLSAFQKSLNKNVTLSAHEIISHQFQKFFQSYAMAFNKQHARVGSLFQTPFKRVLVDDNNYLTRLIYYIHANPQKHNLIADFRLWKWSSYSRIILNKPSKLMKNEVIDWFGNQDAYLQYHNLHHINLLDEKFMMEL